LETETLLITFINFIYYRSISFTGCLFTGDYYKRVKKIPRFTN